MSPTRLQEQPHRPSNNWSRREASPKYLVTKRAVENKLGCEHMHVCRKRDMRGEKTNSSLVERHWKSLGDNKTF